jgi:preprotein translocase subunit SecD
VEGEPIPDQFTVKDLAETFSLAEVLDALQTRYGKRIEEIKELQDRIITLGLDLQGGMRVTLQADFNTLQQDTGRLLTQDEKDTAVRGVLEILNNRINQFGVTEPQIRREGGAASDRILVEMPGAADPEQIRRVIVGKGRLAFHIVDTVNLQRFTSYQAVNPGPYLRSDGRTLISPALDSLLDDDVILRQVVEKDQFGIDQPVGHTVLTSEIGLSGERVQDAFVRPDPLTNRPEVLFNLDPAGGEIFYNLTSENRGQRLAVVLDDNVKAVATIQDAIRDRVRVTGFETKEATDLAVVLKTASLPVPVEIISQEAVGAALGEDTIRQGVSAIFLGLLLVIVFMLVYYKGAGVVANFALLLNFFLMVATLSVFGFTLTLPSIAGFILTVGMAVDANVIIFERIKEEYRLGKTRSASIEAGFQKAFWTIMDANITTGVAALTLAQFGRGPIKGFAVILAVGIVCSMITALFVSRLIFDFVTDVLHASRLSISWRRAK